MKSFLLTLSFLLAVVTTVAAQHDHQHTGAPDAATPQGENLKVPEGWMYRLDKPNDAVKLVSEGDSTHANIFFVNMTPGWHVTTGPAAILYHPALKAEGNYKVRATIHLFPTGKRNEAYGIFVGGNSLDADDQSYLYFVLRNSGEYLIKRRDGTSTSNVTEWTASPAVVRNTAEEGSVKNVLALDVRDDTIDYFLNGEKVASTPREGLPTEGVVGLRINHHLNVHVSELKVAPQD